ncbi:MAG: TipAS antibiotic-recognition domain-containing protein [Lactococcus garvieae]
MALHKEILELFWPEATITPEAHIGLGQMYVEDPRFRSNYNKKHAQLPEYFLEAIQNYYK